MSGAPAGTEDDVVDEDHALIAETIDDEPVVHDLVVAVHRRLESPHHPGERLDGHLDAGAESARLGEQHLLHGHGNHPIQPVVCSNAHRPSASRRARIAGCARACSPGTR